jgi:hypothetical protein
MRRIFRIVAAFIFVSSFSGYALAQSIEWEVVDRFRLFDDDSFRKTGKDRRVKDFLTRIEQLAFSPRSESMHRLFSGTSGFGTNHKTMWDERSLRYDDNLLHLKTRKVELRIVRLAVSRVATCEWSRWVPDRSKDGENKGAWSQISDKCGPITQEVQVDDEQKFRVVIKAGTVIRNAEAVVKVKDIFIAVLGDSYASGEGNPHSWIQPWYQSIAHPAIWWDNRCHRSLAASPVQAAMRLAHTNKKASITFLSFACSGAEIRQGILGKFSGRETVFQINGAWRNRSVNSENPDAGVLTAPLESAAYQSNSQPRPVEHQLDPQIDALKREMCAKGPCRHPDILIVSVGGNDIGFGEIASELFGGTPEGGIQKWRKDRQTAAQEQFELLAKDYVVLAERVRKEIAPHSVLLMEYLDPTRNQAGNVCRTTAWRFSRSAIEEAKRKSQADANTLYNSLLTEGEAVFANWVVRELNSQVAKAARLDWRVEGDHKASVIPLAGISTTGGVCSNRTMFVSIPQSILSQGWISKEEEKEGYDVHKYDLRYSKKKVVPGNISSGILHPNMSAHYSASFVILKTLRDQLPKR